jgi:hypothetical protein
MAIARTIVIKIAQVLFAFKLQKMGTSGEAYIVALAHRSAQEESLMCEICTPPDLGCQMVCFQTKNTNLGKFWRVLRWKTLVYFEVIWSNLWPSGHRYFTVIWYNFPVLVSRKQKNLATLPLTIKS